MRLDAEALDAYTDRFEHEAFRHEVLPAYEVPSDGGDLARYLAPGEAHPDPMVVGPWCDWIRSQVDRGAAVRSLRVLHAPPGDYLRFELEWGHLVNIRAGMESRVLDLTEQPTPRGFIDEEFWLLDRERVAVMTYDDAGRFLHADAVDGPAARRYRIARDVAWDDAEDVESWWARHPQFHRNRQRQRRSA